MNKESLISKEDYTFYKDKRIWSKSKRRFLKGTVNEHGYVQVFLKCNDGKIRQFQWHRVIWFAFNGEIPDGYEVNHIDENKQNNALSNLNLMTHKENINWGTRTERFAAKRRNDINRSKAVVAVKDCVVVMEFPSTKEAERHGFDQSTVSKCCIGKRKTHKGYRWFYKDEWEKIVLLKYIFEELPTEKD